MDLARIIAGMRRSGAEFEDVEVKRAAGGVPETLPSTMSAFANARGGIIILGLDERQASRRAALPTRRPSATRSPGSPEVASLPRSRPASTS